MAARLVRPLYAKLDRGTGDADTPVLRAASNSGAGAPGVLPEWKTDAGERGQAAPPQSAKSFDDRSIKVRRDEETIANVPGDAPLPLPATTRDDGSIKVQRDDETRAEERADAPVSPQEKSSNDLVANSLRNDKVVIEDLEREHEFRTALELMAKAPSRAHTDETLDTKTIIRIAAAVIALGLAFTILLPTILTREPVEPTAALVTSPAPARAVQTEQTEAAQAAPAPRPAELPQAAQAPAPQPAQLPQAAPAPRPPAQLPQAAPPPPVPNASTSVAKTAPALRGSSPPEAKVAGRATEQVLVPSAGKAATRTTLTAAEQAAVTRGLQELEKRPAVSAARRPAPTRPALTAEEQAAVERGLRELAKAAEQAKP